MGTTGKINDVSLQEFCRTHGSRGRRMKQYFALLIKVGAAYKRIIQDVLEENKRVPGIVLLLAPLRNKMHIIYRANVYKVIHNTSTPPVKKVTLYYRYMYTSPVSFEVVVHAQQSYSSSSQTP